MDVKFTDNRKEVLAQLEAERARIPPPPPTELEQLRADVDFIYAMEGLL